MTDRIQLNDDGSLDEVVAGGAHLEHMGGRQWFLAMQRADGSEFCVWFRGKITMTEERPPLTPTPLDASGAGETDSKPGGDDCHGMIDGESE